ncbi:MAG: hypothetical protein AB1715_09335 [Acidobacteriota bacterium]
MSLWNSFFGQVFAVLFLPFRALGPWWGMGFISLLTGLLMLLIYRLTSNQQGIRKVKDKIKAHLLELRLFQHNLSVTLRAQGQILHANFRYLGLNLKPLVVMILPLILILAQLNLWFGCDPLAVGQAAILKVKLEPGVNPLEMDFALEAPPQVLVETPPLRVEESREVDWRIRAAAEGYFSLTVRAGSQSFEKNVAVGGRSLARISALKVKSSFVDEILYPGEKPLPGQSRIESIEVAYAAKRLNLVGLRIHWLVAYLGLSIVFGFVLKRPFKVEI